MSETEFNIQVKNLHQMCRIESEVRGTLYVRKKHNLQSNDIDSHCLDFII